MLSRKKLIVLIFFVIFSIALAHEEEHHPNDEPHYKDGKHNPEFFLQKLTFDFFFK